MDAREVKRFLGRLFEEGDNFEVAFIQPGGRAARKVRAYTPENLPRVLDEMERAEAAGYNVYASALPIARQESRLYDRVWVDQDNPDAPWPFGADERWGDRAAWPRPTTLVKTSDAEDSSGFRYQAIWRLKSELPEADARDLIKRLAAQVGADGSVHDPRRVLRVPGILNIKRGSMARLMDSTTGTTTPEAFALPEASVVERLLTMEVNSPHSILGEWLSGVKEGDRSRKAYICARFLKGCGVGYTDAGGIMKLGAVRCSPAFDDSELAHVLDSAYNRR